MSASGGTVRLALDAMGGDHGPTEVVPGGLRWAKENPTDHLTLVGDEQIIRAIAGGEQRDSAVVVDIVVVVVD